MNQENQNGSSSYSLANETGSQSAEEEKKQPAVGRDAFKDYQTESSKNEGAQGQSAVGFEAKELKSVMMALAQKVNNTIPGDGDSSKDKVIKSDLKIPNFRVREVGQRALDLDNWTKKVKSLLEPISDCAEEFWETVYSNAHKA